MYIVGRILVCIMLNVICVSSTCACVVLRKNTLARIVKFTKKSENWRPHVLYLKHRNWHLTVRASCLAASARAVWRRISILFARCHILQHSDKNNDMLMMIWLLRILIYLRGYEQTDSDRSHRGRFIQGRRLIGQARHFNNLLCRQRVREM